MKNKKRLKLKEEVKNILFFILLCLMLTLSVIVINARIEQTNNVDPARATQTR